MSSTLQFFLTHIHTLSHLKFTFSPQCWGPYPSLEWPRTPLSSLDRSLRPWKLCLERFQLLWNHHFCIRFHSFLFFILPKQPFQTSQRIRREWGCGKKNVKRYFLKLWLDISLSSSFRFSRWFDLSPIGVLITRARVGDRFLQSWCDVWTKEGGRFCWPVGSWAFSLWLTLR